MGQSAKQFRRAIPLKARPLGHLAAFGRLGICALLAIGASPVTAQISATSPTSVAVVPPGPASAENASASGYQDHYLPSTTAPDITLGDNSPEDASGLLRSIQVDAVTSLLRNSSGAASDHVNESGLLIQAQWDTASYGAWSLDAAQRIDSSGTFGSPVSGGGHGVLSVHERQMAFNGGWEADAGLGDIFTQNIRLLQGQSNFYAPTLSIEGATTQWRGPSGTEIVAAVGVPGLEQGLRVPEFDSLGGSLATLGIQRSILSHWDVGAQIMDANHVSLETPSLTSTPVFSTVAQSSLTSLVSIDYHDGPAKAQLNLIDGSTSGSGNGVGAWIDASFGDRRLMQSMGLLHVDPNLSWGNQTIINDAQGGYYRVDYQRQRWQLDGDIDHISSVSGNGPETTFASGDVRYQAAFDRYLGGSVNVSRNATSDAWSVQGYQDVGDRWGSSRVQLNLAADSSARDAQVLLDQSWKLRPAIRLDTSIYLEKLDSMLIGTPSETAAGVQMNGGGQLTSRLSLDGNISWTHVLQGAAAPAIQVNVTANWRLSPNWWLMANVYESHAGSWKPVVVNSPLAAPTALTAPASDASGVFLTVRYQRSAGRPFVPLGGHAGSGWGSIVGTIFLDNNDNDRQDAGETGVANLTVILDGRFSIRTDANGRFEFPSVVSGSHSIAVSIDNLPLPWVLPNDGKVTLTVSTRERADISIAAKRPK